VPNNVWYTLTLNEDTAVQLTNAGSDYFAAIDVFERTAQGDYNLIACDNPRFLARAGTTYYIAVSSPDGPGGTLVFSALNLGPPPANDDIANATAITALDFTDTLNTNGSDYFAAIDVFERTAQGDYNGIAGCSTDFIFVASAGTTYYISVSSPYDPGGNLVFSALGLGAPLQVTLRLNTTGGKTATGTATVGGTVTCNNLAEVDVSGQLRQKVGRRIIVGGFSTHVSCNGVTPWSGLVRSDQGAFGGGKAELLVDAGGCDPFTCDDDHATAVVHLRGK
jgi:predicted DNA-binding protein